MGGAVLGRRATPVAAVVMAVAVAFFAAVWVVAVAVVAPVAVVVAAVVTVAVHSVTLAVGRCWSRRTRRRRRRLVVVVVVVVVVAPPFRLEDVSLVISRDALHPRGDAQPSRSFAGECAVRLVLRPSALQHRLHLVVLRGSLSRPRLLRSLVAVVQRRQSQRLPHRPFIRAFLRLPLLLHRVFAFRPAAARGGSRPSVPPRQVPA